MRLLLFFVILLYSSFYSLAQEFNFQVKVNDQQINAADKRVFREMETAFTDFLNKTSWTQQAYDVNERIDVQMEVTIQDQTDIGSFNANMIVRSVRPVFNSSYSTTTFTFRDNDFGFQYIEGQPLDFNVNSFNSNIGSMLAFYAYYILGMDADTFSPLGGTVYFEQARTIQQIAEGQVGGGWNANQGGNASRNRGALVEGVFNPRLQPLREFMYTYHRQVLDKFLEDADANRKTVADNLAVLKEIRDYNPSTILLVAFFDSKASELAQMFTEGNMAERRKAYELLTVIDPGSTDKYEQILR